MLDVRQTHQASCSGGPPSCTSDTNSSRSETSQASCLAITDPAHNRRPVPLIVDNSSPINRPLESNVFLTVSTSLSQAGRTRPTHDTITAGSPSVDAASSPGEQSTYSAMTPESHNQSTGTASGTTCARRRTIKDLFEFDIDIPREYQERYRFKYRQLQSDLVDYLEKHKKPLQGLTIELLAIGADSNSATPHIVVSCHPKAKRRAERFLRKSDIIKSLGQEGNRDPALKTLINPSPAMAQAFEDSRVALELLEDGSINIPVEIHVQGKSYRGTIGGSVRSTTYGGTSKVYGLTTSHLFSLAIAPELDDETSFPDADSVFSDDSDDGDSTEPNPSPRARDGLSERMPSRGTYVSQRPEFVGPCQVYAAGAVAKDKAQQQVNYHATKRFKTEQYVDDESERVPLGILVPKTLVSESACNLDWALVEYAKQPSNISENSQRSLQSAVFDPMDGSAPASLIHRGVQHFGRLLGRPTSMIVPGGGRFVNVYSFAFDETPRKLFLSSVRARLTSTADLDGISGSWIFPVGAQSAQVYGQVVAKNAFGDLYVVPMVDILKDIGNVYRVPSVSRHEEGFVSEVGGEESSSPRNTIETIAVDLDDDCWSVRAANDEELGKQLLLPETIPRAVAARPEDENPSVRSAAIEPVGKQPVLPDEMLKAVAAHLKDEDPDTRQAAVGVLGKQPPLPDDGLERDRMEIYHRMFSVARRDTLHQAPVPPYGEVRILDVGTGTGIWPIDMADKYTHAEVLGLDLVDIQPERIPPNLRFRVPRDYESPWSLGEDSWDLIHLRMACGSVTSWPKLYQKVFAHLKPGSGWIEHVEIDMQPRCDDGTLDPKGKLVQWYGYLADATWRVSRPIAYNHRTRQNLQAAGFIDIQETVIRVTYNSWPNDPHEKDIGRWYNLCITEGLDALSFTPLTRVYQWDLNAHVRPLLESVKTEICNRKIHAYNNMYDLNLTPCAIVISGLPVDLSSSTIDIGTQDNRQQSLPSQYLRERLGATVS